MLVHNGSARSIRSFRSSAVPTVARGPWFHLALYRTCTGAFSATSLDAMLATASRNEHTTTVSWRAIVAAAAVSSLSASPQIPANTLARGARRRSRRSRYRARASELVLISDKHTYRACRNSDRLPTSDASASAGRASTARGWFSARKRCTSSSAAASSSSLRPATQTIAGSSVFSDTGCSASASAAASSAKSSSIARMPVTMIVRRSGDKTPRSLSACARSSAGTTTVSKKFGDRPFPDKLAGLFCRLLGIVGQKSLVEAVAGREYRVAAEHHVEKFELRHVASENHETDRHRRR